MKKLLIALCVFTACTSPVAKQAQPGASSPVKAAPVDQAQVSPNQELPAANPASEKDVAKVAPKPVVKAVETTEVSTAKVESAHPEMRSEQKIADSIRNSEGGGSDIEGYIPFIKQFFDR